MAENVLTEQGPFVFTSTHRIYFSVKAPVPIAEVVRSLDGLNKLLQRLPGVMEGLTGVNIESGSYHIQRLESGSLLEDVCIMFFFGTREELDAFVLKMGGNKKVKTLVVTAALAGIVGYGMHWASTTTASKQSSSITATNNVIINIGAGEMKMTPEAFEGVVRAAMGEKKDVAANALKFIGPARIDPASSITLDDGEGGAQLTIPHAAIAETPAQLELQKNERLESHENSQLEIRATDLDSKKTGWAGKLGNRPERLKIELAPDVEEADLFGRSKVQVAADLVFTMKGNNYVPTKIYVRKIHPASYPKPPSATIAARR